MNKKVGIAFLSLLMSTCVCGCSVNIEIGPATNPPQDNSTANPPQDNSTTNPPQDSSNGEITTNDDYLKYYENDKYIVAKRVADVFSEDYNNEKNRIFTLDEFPYINFKIDGSGCVSFETNGKKFSSEGLYLADVNQDGCFDMCINYQSPDSKSHARIKIYDVRNDEYIYERIDTRYNYFFDVDENNVLCVMHVKNNSFFKEVIRSSRVLKSSELMKLEDFTGTCRFTGLYTTIGLTKMTARVTSTGVISYIGYIWDVSTYPIKIHEVWITTRDSYNYSYSIGQLTVGCYDASLNFLEPGELNLVVIAAPNFSLNVKVTVLENTEA